MNIFFYIFFGDGRQDGQRELDRRERDVRRTTHSILLFNDSEWRGSFTGTLYADASRAGN